MNWNWLFRLLFSIHLNVDIEKSLLRDSNYNLNKNKIFPMTSISHLNIFTLQARARARARLELLLLLFEDKKSGVSIWFECASTVSTLSQY